MPAGAMGARRASARIRWRRCAGHAPRRRHRAQPQDGRPHDGGIEQTGADVLGDLVGSIPVALAPPGRRMFHAHRAAGQVGRHSRSQAPRRRLRRARRARSPCASSSARSSRRRRSSRARGEHARRELARHQERTGHLRLEHVTEGAGRDLPERLRVGHEARVHRCAMPIPALFTSTSRRRASPTPPRRRLRPSSDRARRGRGRALRPRAPPRPPRRGRGSGRQRHARARPDQGTRHGATEATASPPVTRTRRPRTSSCARALTASEIAGRGPLPGAPGITSCGARRDHRRHPSAARLAAGCRSPACRSSRPATWLIHAGDIATAAVLQMLGQNRPGRAGRPTGTSTSRPCARAARVAPRSSCRVSPSPSCTTPGRRAAGPSACGRAFPQPPS